MNNEFIKAGGAWNNDKDGIDIKLENGLRLTLWPNKYKEEGSRQPDWRVSMRKQDAENMGINEYNKTDEGKQNTANSEIDLSTLPF